MLGADQAAADLANRQPRLVMTAGAAGVPAEDGPIGAPTCPREENPLKRRCVADPEGTARISVSNW